MKVFAQPVIAMSIAEKAHKGQKRRDEKPYFSHVAAVAQQFPKDADVERRTISYLHDTLEDTDLTYEDLERAGINVYTVAKVRIITKGKEETYREYIERIMRSRDEDVIAVKIADLKHNISDGLKTGHQKDKYELALFILETALEEYEKNDSALAKWLHS